MVVDWIKVADKDPEDYARVLAYGCLVSDKEEINLCVFHPGCGFYALDERDYMKEVTHWMKLPQPPGD